MGTASTVVNDESVIEPRWPAPANVRAASTTRIGGVSVAPYATFNLGDHVGDSPEAVARNRDRLSESLNLPAQPLWLSQVHGIHVVDAAQVAAEADVTADGCLARAPALVCAVLTADCLPVLLCGRDGDRVAALHAGWRGLAAGILEAGVAALGGGSLMAWLGPAIGPQAFAVGEDVRAAFCRNDSGAAYAFVPADQPGAYFADLYTLARRRLRQAGVDAVYGEPCCTYSQPKRFFSFRRDGTCGRMATLIWLDG